MRLGLLAWLFCCCCQVASADLLRVGFGTHKPPYIFEGEPQGLEYDLVMAAATLGGLQVTPYYAPMERLHLMLARGELDAIATTSVKSGVPAFYSDAYVEYHNVAVALASRQLQITHIADMARYSVSSFQRARYLLGSEFQVMAERNPQYREEALQINRNRLLYSGRVDLIVCDVRIFKYFNAPVADQVDVSQPLTYFKLFSSTPYSVGFRQSGPREQFNQGLEALRASGDYQRIQQRYAEP